MHSNTQASTLARLVHQLSSVIHDIIHEVIATAENKGNLFRVRNVTDETVNKTICNRPAPLPRPLYASV